MFTEQILKSILSLKTFCAASRAHTPSLEGIHISVDAAKKTITALATDRYALARMVITVPEVEGTSWERNVSLATLNAALATVKAGGPVSSFPELYMPDFPIKMTTILDVFVSSDDTKDGGDFNAKYLGAIAKINVGGDKSGRWSLRMVDRINRTGTVATASHDNYEATVIVMPLTTRN